MEPSELGADLPDAITVDALHQFAYCPRRAYLMHVEGLMAHNAYTEDGRRVHRRVDTIDQALPEPVTPAGGPVHAEPGDASSGGEPPGEPAPKIARSVSLYSSELRLTGKLDLVGTALEDAVPVETKRGAAPPTPQRSYEPERVQLMAQGLLLRANGYRCDHGFLYFAGSRERVRVDFDADIEARTLALLEQARADQARTSLPPPLEDSPKCKGCSVVGICLPDETLALRDAPPDAAAPEVRRLYPPRTDARPLYVQHQGAWIGTSEGNLVIKADDAQTTVRLKDIDHLVLCGNVQVSTQAVHRLCEAGIPVCYLSTGHWFHGFTAGFALRNAYDRAAQFRAADQPQTRLALAQAVVRAKGSNQRTLLRRNADGVPDSELRSMNSLIDSIDACADPDSLLGTEGSLARIYFAHFTRMIGVADMAAGFDEAGRRRRPPPDPLNALLSFGYAMLAKECTVALASVGLDPFWGLYHRPRHGRPALALDLMEEFRPLIVDSAVLTAVNTAMLAKGDFLVGHNGCSLKANGRKAFIRAYEARLEQMITHPTLGYRVSWRTAVRLQARLLARWLRADIPRYVGITTR